MLAFISALVLAGLFSTGTGTPVAPKRVASVVPFAPRQLSGTSNSTTKVFNAQAIRRDVSRIQYKYGGTKFVNTFRHAEGAVGPKKRTVQDEAVDVKLHRRASNNGKEGLTDVFDTIDECEIIPTGLLVVSITNSDVH